MKITNYVDWVNTQKWLRSAVRDWLTYNVPDSRNMRLVKVSFYDTHIYIEVVDREQRKKNMTIKPEELLKYVPDEII